MTFDPTTAYATPPQPKQQQELPGETAKMAPTPDHGETTYKVHERLTGRAAIITGGDLGIGKDRGRRDEILRCGRVGSAAGADYQLDIPRRSSRSRA